MSDKNIQIRHKENGQWGNLYPHTLTENIFNEKGDREIMDARNGEASLKARLDKEHGEVTTQLTQIDKYKNIHSSYNKPNQLEGEEGDIWFVLAPPTWKFIKIQGNPTATIDNITGAIDFDSPTGDRGIIVNNEPLYTNRSNVVRFVFSLNNMIRNDGGALTPLLYKSDEQPQNYDVGNLFLFRLDKGAGTVSVEKNRNAESRITGTPSKITNEVEVTVFFEPITSKFIIKCFDITDKKTLFKKNFTYEFMDIALGDTVWFMPAVDVSDKLGYKYLYSETEIVGG